MYRFLSLICVSLLSLSACNPTFNWREVRWAQDGALKVMLPCKPDQASRPMRVGDQALTLHMVGCETGGVLFAVAVVDVRDTPQAISIQQQWQQAMLDNMQAIAAPDSPKRENFVFRGASEQPTPIRIHATGKRAEGRELQAQAVWFARGGRLYHAALYADRLDANVTQTFFEGLSFP